MNDQEKVVKHLEMIQGVINRLGHDSFLIKGWSMTILAAGMLFLARSGLKSEWIMLAFLFPVGGFWVLDGYFLWQERLFRDVYDYVRKKDTTDFRMSLSERKNESICRWICRVLKQIWGWIKAIFSPTLFLFYAIEIVFVVIFFCILHMERS